MSRTPRTRRPQLVGITATVVLLAVACSSQGSASAPSTTPPTSSTTTVATTTTEPRLDDEELLELARDSVVRVRNTGCGELSIGSAWLAGDARLVSNQHVVEGARYLEASTWDGRDLTITGAEVANGADISRISGDWSAAATFRSLVPRTSRVEPGERIAILGYPAGNELEVTTGVAVGYEFDPELAPREILKLTTVVRPGNSGGPAVDLQGRVVGVVYAKELDTSDSLVIPITDVLGPDAAPLLPSPPCDTEPG